MNINNWDVLLNPDKGLNMKVELDSRIRHEIKSNIVQKKKVIFIEGKLKEIESFTYLLLGF